MQKGDTEKKRESAHARVKKKCVPEAHALTHLHTQINALTQIRTHTHTHIHIHIHIHPHTHTHVHTHTHSQTHTRAQSNTHIHSLTHTNSLTLSLSLSLSLSHTYTYKLSLSLSRTICHFFDDDVENQDGILQIRHFTHTPTHTLALSFSLSLYPSLYLSFSLSQSTVISSTTVRKRRMDSSGSDFSLSFFFMMSTSCSSRFAADVPVKIEI